MSHSVLWGLAHLFLPVSQGGPLGAASAKAQRQPARTDASLVGSRLRLQGPPAPLWTPWAPAPPATPTTCRISGVPPAALAKFWHSAAAA